MHDDFKPMLRLMLFVMILLWVLATCAGCTIKRAPAQQQQTNTSEITHTPATTSQPVPVELVDQDQDGHISNQESQVLIGDRPAVLPTFAMIIGAVLCTSICTAWASSRWRPPEPAEHTSQSSDSPTGTRHADRKLE